MPLVASGIGSDTPPTSATLARILNAWDRGVFTFDSLEVDLRVKD
ncbi:MAG: hypothetical protein R3D57_17785 [Hyphomicrobiaceae bacterium]